MDEFTPEEITRLSDYFARELTPEQSGDVENWINSDPLRKRLVDDLTANRVLFIASNSTSEGQFLDLEDRVREVSARFSESRVNDRAHLSVSQADSRSRPVKNRSVILTNGSLWRSRGVYAMGSLFFGVVLFLFGAQVINNNASHSELSASSMYVTDSGETSTVKLPDGSVILLNVSSRLTVPNGFGEDNRTVYLDGHAYFSVSPKSNSSFTVISGPSVTRVLGTRFAVRYYGDDTVATVSVEDGKVNVSGTVLTKHQTASVSQQKESRLIPFHDRDLAFVNGLLRFEDVDLKAALPELNRWYNADIRIEDPSLLSRKIWGAFERGSITDLVAVLEYTLDLRVEREGRIIKLYGSHN